MARLFALAALCLAAGPAFAERVTTLLSTNRVEIHSTYDGADIVVFGALDIGSSEAAPAQLVITVTGPRGPVTVHRKGRVGPIYINRQRRSFANVPGYHARLSSEPLAGIVAPEVARTLGFDPMADVRERSPQGEEPAAGPFSRALTAIKERLQLYRADDAGITFADGRIFSARIVLPPDAPLGRYYVSSHVFRAGAVIAESRNEFFLTKSGVEARLALEARERPWLYGLAAAILALTLASVAFRRD
jgi:uncharacterized protein (TIGR02186 family)